MTDPVDSQITVLPELLTVPHPTDDYLVVEHKVGGVYDTEKVAAGLVTPVKATGAEVITGTDDAKFATPKALADAGLVPMTKATGAEVTAGTDDAKYTTPKAIKDAGIMATPVKASSAEITTGTDDAKFATPKAIKDAGIVASPPDMLITAAPASDHLVSGIKIVLTAAANLAFGDVCYINSSGKAALIDADAIASMSAVVMCADASISADAGGNFLLMGIARDDTWNWTVGGLIYGTVTGTTGNTLSQTAPTGTDDVIQIMGVATHADRMYFNPQLVQVEHA
jgi:hypothetical protein